MATLLTSYVFRVADEVVATKAQALERWLPDPVFTFYVRVLR